jgi:hypothetical protein
LHPWEYTSHCGYGTFFVSKEKLEQLDEKVAYKRQQDDFAAEVFASPEPPKRK